MATLPRVGDVVRVPDEDDSILVKVVAVDLEEAVWTCQVAADDFTLILVCFDENGNSTNVYLPDFNPDEKDFM